MINKIDFKKQEQKIVEILRKIQEELSFSKDISRSVYWISIDDLNNKKIPVKNYCLNFSLYTLNRLKEKNIQWKMILVLKDDKALHFMIKVFLESKEFFIDIHYGRILFLNNIQSWYKILFESNIYSWEKNIKELFANKKIFLIWLFVRNILYELLEEKKINIPNILTRREEFFNKKFNKPIKVI